MSPPPRPPFKGRDNTVLWSPWPSLERMSGIRWQVQGSFQIWCPHNFRIFWPPPPCPYLDLIYTLKSTQLPLLHLIFYDHPPMRTAYLEAPKGDKVTSRSSHVPRYKVNLPGYKFRHIGQTTLTTYSYPQTWERMYVCRPAHCCLELIINAQTFPPPLSVSHVVMMTYEK